MAIPDFQILMLPVLKTAAGGARWTRASDRHAADGGMVGMRMGSTRGKLRTMVGCMLGNESRRGNIMRALLGTVGMIVLVHAALPALAEDYVVRDAQGRRTETIEQGHGGDLVRRDAEGRRIGTVENDVGKQVLRDREGRRMGTVEER
jgi:hypothetical protein